MDYAAVKDWLDAIVDSIEHQKSLMRFNNRISTGCVNDWVIINGIEFVADEMGIPLSVEYWEQCGKFKYSFEYRDIDFYDLRVCRLEDLESAVHD